MNYQVISITAKIVAAGRTNAGNKYVEVYVENPNDPDDNRTVALFDKEAKPYLDCIAVTKGGNATEDLPIPENRSIWKNCFIEKFVFPEPMVRVDEDGRPQLNKFNGYRYRESVDVLTRYNVDPDRVNLRDKNGNPLSPYYPKPGWSLESRGGSVMSAFYRPLKDIEASAFGGVAPAPTPEQAIAAEQGGVAPAPTAPAGMPPVA